MAVAGIAGQICQTVFMNETAQSGGCASPSLFAFVFFMKNNFG
jgi:hypothetical protein